MESNGKVPSSKHTKHRNIRHYVVTDRNEKYKLSLEWCTKADTIEYFTTKPTQGALFKIFQDQLMGVTESQDPGPGKPKKYREDQVSKYGQKASINASLAHM